MNKAAIDRGKNKVVAGILAIVLGGFGVHHFYLGSFGAGIILLCVSVFTCGFGASICYAISLIEGVVILMMKDEEFNARYNQREPESAEFVFMKST